MNTKDTIIAKQKEYITILERYTAPIATYTQAIADLESESAKEPEGVTADVQLPETVLRAYIGDVKITNKLWDAIIFAMEAYARSKEINLRAELIKYDKYIYNHIHTGETSEVFVNEYLKERENG
jgi:hypothetical protein